MTSTIQPIRYRALKRSSEHYYQVPTVACMCTASRLELIAIKQID